MIMVKKSYVAPRVCVVRYVRPGRLTHKETHPIEARLVGPVVPITQ